MNTLRCLTGIVIFGMASLITSASPREQSRPVSPDAVVRSLYTVHNNGRGHLFDKEGMKNLPRFFDAKMTALIRKDITRTPADEVGRLDFDPLYNAQDVELTEFKIGKPVVTGQQAMVIVTFKNVTRRERLTFLMHQTPRGWRISNLDYGKGESLVKILSARP